MYWAAVRSTARTRREPGSIRSDVEDVPARAGGDDGLGVVGATDGEDRILAQPRGRGSVAVEEAGTAEVFAAGRHLPGSEVRPEGGVGVPQQCAALVRVLTVGVAGTAALGRERGEERDEQ